jgi:hypothetical protein
LKDYVSDQAKNTGKDFGKITVTQDADGKNEFSTAMGSVSFKDGKITAQPLKHENKSMAVNNKPGSKNELLGNVYNVRSVLEHEDRHQTQIAKPTSFKSFRDYANFKEYDASVHQINGKWFKHTTPAFQKLVYEYRDKHKSK